MFLEREDKMPLLNLDLDKTLYGHLKSRANKNYQEVEELAEDIIRRSMISYKKTGGNSMDNVKIDDSLVHIFSRNNKGRKKK